MGKDIIDKITKYDLCLGCGACKSIFPEKINIRLNDRGFYTPTHKCLNNKENSVVKQICPGVSISNDNCNTKSIWGKYIKAVNAWSLDDKIRHDSSSGGVTSSIAIYLIEHKKVDGILHVGVQENDFLNNKLYLSKTREEILKRNSSRYAPVDLLENIINILDSNPHESYAFIGKPCDIAALKNVLRIKPEYKLRIKYFLAIFCAGMPSYNATKKAIESLDYSGEPVSLRYRGNGWPGFFTVKYADGASRKMTYNDSWGKILGKDLGFRCKVCPDGIGLLADISSGDSWNTKDGYPDFTEGDGKNFCFIRTKNGLDIFEEASRLGYIESEYLDVDGIKKIQKYQFDRRHQVGWRLLAVKIMTGRLVKYRNTGVYRFMFQHSVIDGLRQFKGTVGRLIKINKNGK